MLGRCDGRWSQHGHCAADRPADRMEQRPKRRDLERELRSHHLHAKKEKKWFTRLAHALSHTSGAPERQMLWVESR